MNSLRVKLSSFNCSLFYVKCQVDEFEAVAMCIYKKRPWYSRWLDLFPHRRNIIADVRPIARAGTLPITDIKQLCFYDTGSHFALQSIVNDILDAVPGRVDGMMGFTFGKLEWTQETARPTNDEDWWGNIPAGGFNPMKLKK